MCSWGGWLGTVPKQVGDAGCATPALPWATGEGMGERDARHECGKMLLCIIWEVKWLIHLHCNNSCF